QIETALRGRTPYEVSDLVFDWSRIGPEVHVAVVARVTLDEAEEFADAHGFNPVSFVSIPGPGEFAGEPFFGTTSQAGAYIAKGERVDRDQDPINIVAASEQIRHVAVPSVAPPDEDEPTSASDEPDTPEPLPDYDEMPLPVDPQALAPANITAALPSEEPAASPAGDGSTDTVVRPADLAATLAPDPGAGGLDAPFISVDDLEDLDRTGNDHDPIPSFSSRRSGEFDAEVDESNALGRARLTLDLSDVQSEPEFAPEDKGNGDTNPDFGITAPILLVSDSRIVADAPSMVSGPTTGRSRPGLAPMAEAMHGTQAQQKVRQGQGLATPVQAKPSRGAFGATIQGATRALPRRLFVAAAILTLAILALAGVWFVFATDKVHSGAGTGPALVEAEQAAATPDPQNPPQETTPSVAEIPRDAAPVSEQPTDVVEADVITDVVDADPPVALPDQDAVPEDGAVAVAESDAAVEADIAPPVGNDIWSTGPVAAKVPSPDAVSAPAITGLGHGPTFATSAGSLATSGEVNDLALTWQPLPPPYGTVFEFLPDGSIRPSPEGIVTPDGFTIIAGRPPVQPTRRPGSPEAETLPEPTPEVAPGALDEPASAADPDLNAAPIDQGLVGSAIEEAMSVAPETAEAALPAPVDPSHAAKKPRARPDEVVARAAAARAAAEAEAKAERAREAALASATAQAVATSQRPRARPNGLARAVENAVTAAVTDAITNPTPAPKAAVVEEVDEPEPLSPTPNIPTSVTVAKQATIKNALDLGEISLIGVFGSSANRRALVRMPTGRMIKLKIGDRLNGGKVAAIGDSELSYVKSGRTYVLKMLKKS
ncbi:MAG: hypothetical protein WA822_16370, partial [Albidovulum sp.]